MEKHFRVLLRHAIAVALFLAPASIVAQATDNNAAQTDNGPAQQNTSQNSQAVSQTGLFPVFAVNMNFPSSLVDGAVVPSASANNGVDNTLQHAWDTLKGSGFNMIAFRVDIKDPQAAARVANMCIWAKANNVSLVPVLANASPGLAAAFPTALISALRGSDGQQFAAYAQISFFQLENPVNVPLPEAKAGLPETQKLLLAAVDSLRAAEIQALAGTGVQATPIMVTSSFDYELVRQGAIVGVPLDPAAEQKAMAALKKSLLPFAGNSNVNAVRVEWFPRSITSGDEGHFVSLLRELEASVPDKKVVLDTGFSTAFNSGEQQSQFMTVALTNLAGLRAEEGANGGFLGITVSQAFDNSKQQVKSSAATVDTSQWNWNEKAKQLDQMWSQGSKSAELTSWLERVRAGRTLLTTQAGADPTPAPGLQAIQQFSATVAQVSQNMAQNAGNSGTTSASSTSASTPTSAASPGSSAPAPADASANATPAPAATAQPSTPPAASSPSAFQQTFQSLIQQVTTQLTTSLVTKLNNKLNNPSPSQPAYPAQNGANYAQYPTPPGSAPAAAPALPAQPVPAADAQNSSTPSSPGAAPAPAQDPAAQAAAASPNPAPAGATDTQNAGAPSNSNTNNSGPQNAASQAVPAAQSGTPAVSPADGTGTSANANAGSTTAVAQTGSGSGTQTANSQPGQTSTSGGTGNGTGTGASTQTNDPNSSSSGQGTSSTTQTVPVTVIRPKIVYFGPPAAAGSGQSLSLQVTNPGSTVINSAQAQLFVDGKPGSAQPLGAFLPNQTRSVTLDASAIPAGARNIKVVVTTPEGASVSATSGADSATGDPHRTGPHKLPGTVHAGLPVRAGLSSGYRIGSVRAAPVPTPTPASTLSGGSAGATMAPAPSSNQASTAPDTSTTTIPNPTTVATTASPTFTPSPTTSANQVTTASGTIAPNSSSPLAAAIAAPAPSGQTASTTATRMPVVGQTAGIRTIGAAGASNSAVAVPVVPQPRANQTGTAAAPVIPNSSLQVRSFAPRSSTSATNVVLPGSSQQAGGTAVNPQTPATTLSPASATPAPGVRTLNTPSTATVLTASNSNQATAVRIPGGPGSAVTPAFPPRPGQFGAAQVGAPGAQGFVDLSVAAAEIHFRPVAPGQPLQCTAVIHNLGTAGVIGASVVFTLNADGKALSSGPTVFNLGPGGAYLAGWNSVMPAAQSVLLMVQVTAKGDANAGNNQAMIRLR